MSKVIIPRNMKLIKDMICGKRCYNYFSHPISINLQSKLILKHIFVVHFNDERRVYHRLESICMSSKLMTEPMF